MLNLFGKKISRKKEENKPSESDRLLLDQRKRMQSLYVTWIQIGIFCLAAIAIPLVVISTVNENYNFATSPESIHYICNMIALIVISFQYKFAPSTSIYGGNWISIFYSAVTIAYIQVYTVMEVIESGTLNKKYIYILSSSISVILCPSFILLFVFCIVTCRRRRYQALKANELEERGIIEMESKEDDTQETEATTTTHVISDESDSMETNSLIEKND
jgi:hypothetical protein